MCGASLNNRQGRFIHHAPHNKTGLHPADAFDAGDFVQQQLLVGVHVFDDDLELVVGGLAGDEQAFHDFGQGADFGFKVGEAFGGVAVHGNVDQGHEGEAEFFGVEQGAVADDEAVVFEGADAAQTGGGGQADFIGEVLVADAAVLLEDFEDLAVVAV